MTLILTELSNVGIAMAADSAIAIKEKGRLHTDRERRDKLIRVPRINAAISYWGWIGDINRRFDTWVRTKIKSGQYNDLLTFADYISGELNKAMKGVPLSDGHEAGIHIAGFYVWPDGVRRPTFYHVHNGHKQVKFISKWELENGEPKISSTQREYVTSPRELFSRHDDVGPDAPNSNELRTILDTGNTYFTIVNGDFEIPVLIINNLKSICNFLNTIREDNVEVKTPRDPDKLRSRVGLLRSYIKIIVTIYGCSSLPKLIGGNILSLGIRSDGYLPN